MPNFLKLLSIVQFFGLFFKISLFFSPAVATTQTKPYSHHSWIKTPPLGPPSYAITFKDSENSPPEKLSFTKTAGVGGLASLSSPSEFYMCRVLYPSPLVIHWGTFFLMTFRRFLREAVHMTKHECMIGQEGKRNAFFKFLFQKIKP